MRIMRENYSVRISVLLDGGWNVSKNWRYTSEFKVVIGCVGAFVLDV